MLDPSPTRVPATRVAIIAGFARWLEEHEHDPSAMFIFRVTDGTRGLMHAEQRESVYFTLEEPAEPGERRSDVPS